MLQRAATAGVEVLSVSTDRPSSERTAAIPGVWKAVGVHPTRAATADDVSEWLPTLAQQPGVLAIGECGFDDTGPAWELQRVAFEAQLALARDHNLTVILHIDGPSAWRELTRTERDLAGLRVVRHYFAGGAGQAAWHSEQGHWLSFGRPVLREPRLQEIAASYPSHLLLIETDTYPLPGRTTEPKDVVEVGEALAQLRHWDVERCAQQLAENAVTAFPGQAPT